MIQFLPSFEAFHEYRITLETLLMFAIALSWIWFIPTIIDLYKWKEWANIFTYIMWSIVWIIQILNSQEWWYLNFFQIPSIGWTVLSILVIWLLIRNKTTKRYNTYSVWIHAMIQLKGTNKYLFLCRSSYKTLAPLHWDLAWWALEMWEQMNSWIEREIAEEIWIDLSSTEKASLKTIWTHSFRVNKANQLRWNVVLYHLIVESDIITISWEHTEYKRLTLDEATLLKPQRSIVSTGIQLSKKHQNLL